MPRACKHWLLSFRDWTLPRSEAPENFIFWTGLFALSSVIKRKVKVPKRYLGSWECYPHMYLMFVSPPAQGRKTTTIDYADDLLGEIPNIQVASHAMTQQVLMKRLADSSDSSISIRSKEFGTFYKPSGDLMIDFLTDLYDGKKSHSSDTLMRGVEFATNPCVNMLAATTPKWITENLSEVMIGGGFTSRVVFLYEEKVRRRQMFYESLDLKALDKIREKLVADLTHLSSNIEGEFFLDDDCKTFIEQWYRKTADKYVKEDSRLHGYFERKPAHALKVAMLLHIAYSDELVLTKDDFEQALGILKQIELKMIQVFQGVGKNPYIIDMDAIKEFIAERTSARRSELQARFRHAAEPEKLLALLTGMVTMGELTIDGSDPRDIVYRIVEKKKVVDLTKTTVSQADDPAKKDLLPPGFRSLGQEKTA